MAAQSASGLSSWEYKRELQRDRQEGGTWKGGAGGITRDRALDGMSLR